MLRQLNNISKFTTSSLKYAANNTASMLINLSSTNIKDDSTLPSIQLLAYWINETQKGLDAFFNDDFELAQSIFMQHHEESPFHAVGYALISYVEAMLGFETPKILIALERISYAESLAKQFIKKTRKRSWYTTSNNHCTTIDSLVDSVSFQTSTSKITIKSTEIYYELISLNCMLMSSTIQFLRNNWLEYMKAAYKLRKAYKLYEQMFESITGKKASEYLSKKKKFEPVNTNTWNDKRKSLFQLPISKKISLESLTNKKRPMSTLTDPSIVTLENTIESGVFFGIGLFSLIFSLLPPKVNKILNTLGFQSSRPFALEILEKSFRTRGLYSSLSALSLLVYYTNLSMFIHPFLLPSNSLNLEKVRKILDQMKLSYPNGKIWKLLEGKLCKMEGKTRKGVEILRDARRRQTIRMDGGITYQKKSEVCDLAQLQALAVYEMGWGQIFLGDYFQAAETFFRLESMNNWSRAFYHYIATCCIFADDEHDKAAIEFMQIPNILNRKRQLGARLLPNEIFVERKIRHWKNKQIIKNTTKKKRRKRKTTTDDVILTGSILKQVIVINPLWELIYLWNGFSQLSQTTLQHIKQSIETTLATVSETEIGIDMPQLYLLLGVSVRELGDIDLADMYLRQAFKYENDLLEDQWVIPHSLYEMAVLCCFKLVQSNNMYEKKKLYQQALEWIKESEHYLSSKVTNDDQQEQPETLNSSNTGDSDWDSRLHVRCQLLIEKLDELGKF